MATLADLVETLEAARREIGRVIIGQSDVVDKALITIVTGHHALIEGVPGIAKTLLVRTLGRVLGCEFARIQFTPDLMPADITGTNIFNIRDNTFTLVRGPVFTGFLLADEINRAPAKTQSALLQAMQERRVTVDRDTLPLSPHFTVFATQNPIEFEGTYPLPEAQKDRFLFKIPMDYPGRAEELTLAERTLGADAPERTIERDEVREVLPESALAGLQAALEQVAFRPELLAYLVDLVRATRTQSSVLSGAGPRATQGLAHASRAQAALAGRDFVIPDDIRSLALAVLGHRMVLRPEFEIEGLTVAEVVHQILEDVPVPR